MAMEPHALVSINVFVCQYSIQILLCMALVDDAVLHTYYFFTPIFPFYWLKLTLLSRNARENENNRFDEISSNRVNVYRFDDHGES